MDKTERENEQSKWFGAALLDEEQSRLGSAIFFLICAILVFSTAAYGAVDTWALGFLTFISGVITIFWILKAFFTREFRFNSSSLQAPILGLITIGLIQLLPLRSSAATGLLTFPAVNSLSLDAYSTRLFVIQLVVYLVFFAAALTFIKSKTPAKNCADYYYFVGQWRFTAFFSASPPRKALRRAPDPDAIPFASVRQPHHFASFRIDAWFDFGFLLKGVHTDKNPLRLCRFNWESRCFFGSRADF